MLTEKKKTQITISDLKKRKIMCKEKNGRKVGKNNEKKENNCISKKFKPLEK